MAAPAASRLGGTRAAARLGLLLALLLGASVGWSQVDDRPGLRIAYVDMLRLIEGAPQVQASRQRLELEFAESSAVLEADQARLSELEQRLETEGDFLAGEERARLERETETLRRAVCRSQQLLRERINARRATELARLEREINETAIQLAREEGFDLVIPGPVVYASPRIDLTDRVLDRLRQAQRSP